MVLPDYSDPLPGRHHATGAGLIKPKDKKILPEDKEMWVNHLAQLGISEEFKAGADLQTIFVICFLRPDMGLKAHYLKQSRAKLCFFIISLIINYYKLTMKKT
ncbi:hypothetical protein AMECASPLE_020419 [Ameca splendens]|uniref:Uncharacterized protein n=1 Tax=Ameca splendens TaxID=208324 RepID=A0ABV0XS75_9TELE